ncbi:cytochrome d ubiquinol oxidase subunit II [Streptomyces sp. SBT349]|uniref:cytochrome d ubiquinol oxidase subunit II n=1 Tax=Streptomyces sp. SBT349 TaxID=1580539 RepID=UPI0007C6D599|nr:cytochrome d ubiquinol oxidase subunit II [Streptomyces sp. SBT349]
MELIAAALLALFTAGYFVLGGADIGLGMLLPHLGRDEAERRLTTAALWPLFLGNEVWLVAAGGVLAGCFPALEGEVFPGLLPVLVPLLAGWVLRDAGLWWRRRVPLTGDVLITAGSWAVALAWGWLAASLPTGEFAAPAPPALGAPTAVAVALLFLAHGLGFATLRLTGAPFQRARTLAGRQAGWNSFALTSAVMAALPVLAGARLPLTEHAASTAVLGVVVPVLLVALPPLAAVQVWLWRVAGGRATAPPADPDPDPGPGPFR